MTTPVPRAFCRTHKPRLQRRIARGLRSARRVVDIACGNCDLADLLAQDDGREAKRVLRLGGEVLIVDFPRCSLAQRLWNEDYYTTRHREEDETMPIFEYKCKVCGYVTEVLERSGSRAAHECQKCGSPQVGKLLSAFGVGKGRSSSSSSCPTGTCPLP